jgi:YhgE/Pip N-terminal domain/YhgE/Pip C-terminal domain
MKTFIASYKAFAREGRSERRNLRFIVSAIAVAFVPLLYAFIFISSMKDPYGNLSRLPAAIVDLDRGAEYRGKRYELGAQLERKLLAERPVDFRSRASAEEAEAAVRRGELYFALVIPEDFSERALAADSSRRAQLMLFDSQGGNYFAAHIAESVASRVAASVNAELASGRWAAVGAALPELAAGMGSLRTATDKLAAGSSSLAAGLEEAKGGGEMLAEGSAELAGKVDALGDGVAQLASGIRKLDEAAPSAEALAPLKDGAASVASGASSLASGLRGLDSGVIAGQKKAGLLGAPLKQVEPHVKDAADGAAKLAQGSAALSTGVATLADGNAKVKGALDAMAGRLPSDADLGKLKDGAAKVAAKNAELSSGLDKLAGGASQLAAGLDELRRRLPSAIAAPDGDADGLATSVVVCEEASASVANNGEAFAPYFIAISLWIGMLIATFVFDYAKTAARAATLANAAERRAFIAQSLALPALLVIAQAALALWGAAQMGIRIDHPALAALALAASGLCFLAIVFALNAFLGDAGKLLCVILLVVQVGSAGGSFPIELAPAFFRVVHDYLPVSDAVTALRYAFSGAYEGRYADSLGRIAATGAAFLAIALLVRPSGGLRRRQSVAEVAGAESAGEVLA